MILKTKNGDFVELSQSEYLSFKIDFMLEMMKEKKCDIYIRHDHRVEGAKMLIDAIARNGTVLSDEQKQSVLMTAAELMASYNNSRKEEDLTDPIVKIK